MSNHARYVVLRICEILFALAMTQVSYSATHAIDTAEGFLRPWFLLVSIFSGVIAVAAYTKVLVHFFAAEIADGE
jgi:hypothetical protein